MCYRTAALRLDSYRKRDGPIMDAEPWIRENIERAIDVPCDDLRDTSCRVRIVHGARCSII